MNNKAKKAVVEFMENTGFQQGFDISQRHKHCSEYQEIVSRQETVLKEIWEDMLRHDELCNGGDNNAT